MNDILNENQLTFKKEYKIDKPLFHKLISLFDNCIGDCHNKDFHAFMYNVVYDKNFTSIANDEKIKITIADKEMNLYGLSKEINFAWQKGFIFNQIKKINNKTLL